MKRQRLLTIGAMLLIAATASLHAATADFEVTGPDGRRILLQDDKTWRYLDAKDTKDEKSAQGTAEKDKDGKDKDAKDDVAGAEKPKDPGEAILHLEGKVDGNRICRFQLRLVNNLPYEIRSLVPEFSAYRANGVIYESVFMGFAFLKPGDTQRREIRFNGLACPDIARVQVTGGDRCEMGQLDKFSPVKGQCLAPVRVVASEVVRFDK